VLQLLGKAHAQANAAHRRANELHQATARGNFDFVPPIGYWIEETDERQRYLDVIEEEPRIMLRGATGSGKTSLSLAYAQRRVVAGDSVLFACFNKNLRGFLEGCLDQRVNPWTFHDLLDADLPADRMPERPRAAERLLRARPA
jgi:hypothetical protein